MKLVGGFHLDEVSKMKYKPHCSCGWEPKLIGEGHCSKHHTNYRVLNEGKYLCFECQLEETQKLFETVYK